MFAEKLQQEIERTNVAGIEAERARREAAELQQEATLRQEAKKEELETQTAMAELLKESRDGTAAEESVEIRA